MAVPSAPILVHARNTGNGAVRLVWKPGSGGGTPVTYEVYRDETGVSTTLLGATEEVAIAVTAGTNEVNTLTVTASTGSFKLTHGAVSTDWVAVNCTSATLQAAIDVSALVGLITVGTRAGSVNAYEYPLTFGGASGFSDITSTSTKRVQGVITVIDNVVTGVPGTDEQDTMLVVGAGAGTGTFTLTYDGGTPSAPIALDAAAATVQSAINGLDTIVAADITVTVTDNATPGNMIYTITWMGNGGRSTAFADGALVANITDDAVVDIVTTVPGDVGNDEQQTIDLNLATAGTFTVTFGGEVTTPLAFDVSAEDMQAALRLLSTIGPGNVNVALAAPVYTLTFVGGLAKTGVAEVTVQDIDLTAVSAPLSMTETVAAVPGTNSKKSVEVAANAGTFTLTFDDQTTSAIAVDASAATVELAFEALSSVGAGNGTVTEAGAPGDKTYTIEFTGDLRATDLDATAITYVDTSAWVESAATMVETIPGIAGGTWTATFDSLTTDAIDFDAEASAVEALMLAKWLTADPIVGPGDLSVARTGAKGAYTYTVTWANEWAAENVGAITVASVDLGNFYDSGTQAPTIVATTTAGIDPLQAALSASGYAAGDLPWFDTTGSDATDYYFGIRAVNADGKSDLSNVKHVLRADAGAATGALKVNVVQSVPVPTA